MQLPQPKPEAIIYEDKQLYIALANYPIARGHTVVVWKNKVKDLHLLSKKEYEYLMDKVDITRNALLKTLKLKKVYLVYADEANQVHWHLVPRFNSKGFNILIHKPSRLKDFSLARKIKQHLQGSELFY
ncbi:MAG TPA: HIT family protein [Candidatus Paceibacterota bacterium]|nr:HIT family protein [Candidatus Paceibacterota bacterium]